MLLCCRVAVLLVCCVAHLLCSCVALLLGCCVVMLFVLLCNRADVWLFFGVIVLSFV